MTLMSTPQGHISMAHTTSDAVLEMVSRDRMKLGQIFHMIEEMIGDL